MYALFQILHLQQHKGLVTELTFLGGTVPFKIIEQNKVVEMSCRNHIQLGRFCACWILLVIPYLKAQMKIQSNEDNGKCHGL